MTTEEACILSFYQSIATIDNRPDIHLAKHIETGELFVKKELKTYNRLIYEQFKANPVINMPMIYECIEDNGQLVVIEEYIHGYSLKTLFEKNGPMPEDQLAYCMRNICRTLEQLHACTPPIIHRDIKPSNILITREGNIKLIDINIAKSYTEGFYQDTVLMGTKEFAAPEQYGFAQSDARTDIYAIGVTLNYLLCGEYPKTRLHKGKLTPIIQKCIELDPKNRYQNAAELEDALHHIQTVHKVSSISRFLPSRFHAYKLWKIILMFLGCLNLLRLVFFHVIGVVVWKKILFKNLF